MAMSADEWGHHYENLTRIDPDLSRFLIKAKTNAYASGQEPTRLDGGEKEFTFEEGDFKYRDRYFLAKNNNSFTGGEIVWFKESPIWGMNYTGTYAEFTGFPGSTDDIDAFLRKALSKIPEDKPFRGPPQFKEGDLEYVNDVHGNWDLFRGHEKILYRGEEQLPIYQLRFQGCKL